jgi:hypothetical protein
MTAAQAQPLPLNATLYRPRLKALTATKNNSAIRETALMGKQTFQPNPNMPEGHESISLLRKLKPRHDRNFPGDDMRCYLCQL